MDIQATEYIHRNGSLVLRKALPYSDPESWQSLWKDKFGSLEEFPYEDLYEEDLPQEELIKMGIMKCPTCKRYYE